MKRRSAIRNLGLTLGGLMSLPAWASGWTPVTLGYQGTLSTGEEALLAELVDTIIPASVHKGAASPGAKELKVHQFVLRMINDCYGEEAKKTLEKGLAATEEAAKLEYDKSFTSLSPQERVAVLTTMSTTTEGTARPFVSMIKNLTIQGYTNSEYYMTNIAGYVMAPGFYHGCVPISKLAVR